MLAARSRLASLRQPAARLLSGGQHKSAIGYGSGDIHEAVYTDTNFPRADGRVLHLDLANGDLHPRVLSVGDPSRAERLSLLLDDGAQEVFHSGRGFAVHSGTFQGTPLSIVTTGMGLPMMDFVVREGRAVVEGPMLMVRFGSCGGTSPRSPAGSVVMASEGSVLSMRNPDAWGPEAAEGEPAYRLSRPVMPDEELTRLLDQELRAVVGDERIVHGVNVTCCSFYSSQGRVDPAFDDRNEGLIDAVMDEVPRAVSMEMETFHLLDLARCSKGSIRASAAAVVLANRISDDVLPGEEMERMETEGGKAIMRAMVACSL